MSFLSIPPLTIRSKVIVLSLLYLILQIQDFSWGLGHEFGFMLGKFIVFILLLIQVRSLPVEYWFRNWAVPLFLCLVWLSYQLDLWTISAKAYLSNHQNAFSQVAVILRSKGNCSLNKNTLTNPKDSTLTGAERRQIVDLLTETSVIEVDCTNEGKDVLFTFDRFLDNGYGFAFINDPTILRRTYPKGSYPRVLYDLTNWYQLSGNWYYVSFT